MEDMTAFKDKVIVDLQKRVRALEAANLRHVKDNIYIKKVLCIALRRMRGTPLVVSEEELSEAGTEFSLDENLAGDHLIWAKGSKV